MSEPTVIIERPNAAARNQPVTVVGRTGTLGVASWDEARGCHCLRIPLSKYRPERQAISQNLRKFDKVAIDLELGQADISDVDSQLEKFRLQGETTPQTLARVLTHLEELRSWIPAKGKKPEIKTPQRCSPPAN